VLIFKPDHSPNLLLIGLCLGTGVLYLVLKVLKNSKLLLEKDR